MERYDGPWTYRKHDYDDWGIVRDANNYIVCQVRQGKFDEDVRAKHRRDGTDPWEIPARLVCAAPELLEALEVALDLLTSSEIDGLARKARVRGFTGDVRKIRAAIARARGKTS